MLKRKSRFAMIVAILLMLTFAVETSLASAATLSQIRNNIKNKQQELNESRAKEKSLGDQGQLPGQQINSKQSDIDELEASISEAQAKLETLEEELAAAEEKVNTQNENLNARLRNMYKKRQCRFYRRTDGFTQLCLQRFDFFFLGVDFIVSLLQFLQHILIAGVYLFYQ